jgi:hypothetical protein
MPKWSFSRTSTSENRSNGAHVDLYFEQIKTNTSSLKIQAASERLFGGPKFRPGQGRPDTTHKKLSISMLT